jgi:hypothetical protein
MRRSITAGDPAKSRGSTMTTPLIHTHPALTRRSRSRQRAGRGEKRHSTGDVGWPFSTRNVNGPPRWLGIENCSTNSLGIPAVRWNVLAGSTSKKKLVAKNLHVAVIDGLAADQYAI